MKALTLRQPWATLMACGLKGAETRGWRTDHRGPLAIHSASLYSAYDQAFTDERPEIQKLELPLGKVLCIVELVACVPTGHAPMYAKAAKWVPPIDWMTELEYGNFQIGRWAWLTRPIRVLPAPIAAKGALSLWEWEAPWPCFG